MTTTVTAVLHRLSRHRHCCLHVGKNVLTRPSYHHHHIPHIALILYSLPINAYSTTNNNSSTLGTPSPSTSSSSSPAALDNPSLYQLLSKHSYALPARSTDIHVIDTPTNFYNQLIQLIQSAKYRVILSSLYLGTGPLEKKLVETLVTQCKQQPALKVQVLLDYLRGTRPVGQGQKHHTYMYMELEMLLNIATTAH